MGNFIKIDRKILEWEWYRNEHTKNVFLHCLLKANWKDSKFEGKEVPRGSFITSIKKIALELDLTEDEVKTALKHLLKTGELTKQTTNKYTVITVSNYELYQEVAKQNQNNSQTDTEPLPNNSTSITNLLPTIEEYKEGEEDKEVKKESKEDNNTPPVSPSQGEADTPKKSKRFVPPTVDDVEQYCFERNNGIDGQAFVDFYESKGWMVGKNKMVSWKAAVRTWERERKKNGGGNGGCTRRNDTSNTGRDEYAEELERMLNGG